MRLAVRPISTEVFRRPQLVTPITYLRQIRLGSSPSPAPPFILPRTPHCQFVLYNPVPQEVKMDRYKLVYTVPGWSLVVLSRRGDRIDSHGYQPRISRRRRTPSSALAPASTKEGNTSRSPSSSPARVSSSPSPRRALIRTPARRGNWRASWSTASRFSAKDGTLPKRPSQR